MQKRIKRIHRTVSFISVLFSIMLILTSCRNEGEKIKKKQIIPEKDLVPVLTDLYLTDGLLSIVEVRKVFSEKDTTQNYIDVLAEHGYTKSQMDKTIHFYLLRNPKKLEKIYDKVIAKLSEMESRLETEVEQHAAGQSNLWPKETTVSVPETGLYNSVGFEIPVSDTGTYVLTFNAIVYKDDQSINPRATIYFWQADSTKEGIKDFWGSADFLPDGTQHNYNLSKKLSDTLFTHIKGFLLDCDPQTGRWQKHMRISDIFLTKDVPE
jgi:hypothetical protein